VGDVVGSDATLGEIAARAQRIVRTSAVVSRFRGYGPLRLDLLDRDGFVDGKPLGLHSREFGLLWRLMESPGEEVDKAALLRDVWRLSHMPETNSIAVHASRLRGKLAFAGLRELVRTSPSGAYFIATASATEGVPALIAPPAGYQPRQDAAPRPAQSG
jgi:two-component system OmpR family response regulator